MSIRTTGCVLQMPLTARLRGIGRCSIGKLMAEEMETDSDTEVRAGYADNDMNEV